KSKKICGDQVPLKFCNLPARKCAEHTNVYYSEPQLRYDFDPFEWLKSHEKKYPLIAELAKKYLSIPATSVSSERCFSTAGNVVTSKRNCLAPENVNMLVFLYQNRQLLL
ncbi:zinc finger BED domain-containing protein 1-like, partial [Aphis craccivora]